ncbi:MAG: hypothetical protein AAFQ80_10150 [Cyanobacteria bacterium J06621_8]
MTKPSFGLLLPRFRYTTEIWFEQKLTVWLRATHHGSVDSQQRVNK